MSFFIKKLVFPILCFMAVFLMLLYFITYYQKTDTSVNYTLKSYKNTVALYNGEKVIKIYNNIVLNTLPQKDIQNFNSGISISNPSQAEEYLENFE